MTIVGIFGTWDYSLFDKPENVFKFNLDLNPVYPFEEVEYNIFVLTVKSARFTLAATLCAITAACTVLIFVSAGSLNEYVIFPLLVFLGFMCQAIWAWEERTYVLDSNEKMYEFYRGNKLIYRGHYHNIYIRLKGQSSGGGETYYSVVLDGYHVDEEAITSTTTKMKMMAKMGRKLAHRLDINYFDSPDKSRAHVIRHRCPYRHRGTSP